MSGTSRSTIISVSILAVLAGACAVGPDFHQPQAPDVTQYTASPLPQETAAADTAGGEAQRLVSGETISARWWTLFRSDDLDRIIDTALADNPSLAAARATLRQAQENVNALVGSSFYPQVDADAAVSRDKISGAAFGQPAASFSPFTLYSASVKVSYALDLFGGARRELEALRSQVDYERFQLEGAYLTIASTIVATAVREAALRAEIRATEEIAAFQEKQLGVAEQQFRIGAVARSDVLAQRAQLAQTRASVPPLEKALAQTRHQLAVLAGKLPAEEQSLPEFDLDALQLPRDLPVSLPSSLVRQRPDIRASESLLHAASANVGVATANLFPQISLSGSYGSQAIKTNELFHAGSTVWGLSAGLLQPLFHGGALTAQRRAAVAAYDQAAAAYRMTVLQAFQNTADVLRALEADARTLRARAEAEAAARESLDLTQRQFQLGAVSYLSLLNAERQHQQARIGVIEARATRYTDTAALFQALGGGWWNREGNSELQQGAGNREQGVSSREQGAGSKE